MGGGRGGGRLLDKSCNHGWIRLFESGARSIGDKGTRRYICIRIIFPNVVRTEMTRDSDIRCARATWTDPSKGNSNSFVCFSRFFCVILTFLGGALGPTPSSNLTLTVYGAGEQSPFFRNLSRQCTVPAPFSPSPPRPAIHCDLFVVTTFSLPRPTAPLQFNC